MSMLLIGTHAPMSAKERHELAEEAEQNLRAAYFGFKRAGCPQIAKRLRATLKSAQGAVRHAAGRADRDDTPECEECSDGAVMSDTCDECGQRHCWKCEPCQ